MAVILNATPTTEALVRAGQLAAAQGATVLIQSFVAGALTINPAFAVAAPLLNVLWKFVRAQQEAKHGVGRANWFWKIF